MSTRNNLKAAAYLSFGIFILLLAGALYYWNERMFFADASHIAFCAINEEALQIQQFRFGAFITQMVPVLGAKLGLSLKAILIAYSASFHLFYLFVAAVLMFGFKAYRLVILYAFYWVLVTTHTFFWPNNEVHQGIAYMFLILAFIIFAGERKYNFSIPLLLLVVLGATAAFCHPLVLPPFIFLWVYFIVEKKHWHYTRQQTTILSAVLALIVIVKMYVSSVYAVYDVNLLSGVRDVSPMGVIGAFASPFAKEVYRHIPMNYTLFPIIIVIGLVTLLFKKQYFLAVWTLGCVLVYFILLCLTYPGYLEFISESEIMALILIGTAPFVFVTLTLMKKEVVFLVVLVIFGVRVYKFRDSSWHFSQRVQELANLIGKMKRENLTKVVLVQSPDKSIEWRWMVEWGIGAETAMLSACVWDNPVRQLVVMNPEELEIRLPKNNTDMLGSFKTFPIETVNMKYFHFDTTRPYTVIDYDEFMK